MANSEDVEESKNPGPNHEDSDLSSILTHELPEVSERENTYINEPENEDEEEDHKNTPSEPEEKHDDWRGRISSKGDRFIPELHEFPPRELKSGKWAKKRGRKSGGVDSVPEESKPNPSAKTRKHAETLSFMYADLHQLIYGKGGKVESVEDIAGLAGALELYMQANGDIEASPGWSVLFNMFGYSRSVAARKENEKINEKIGRFFVKSWRWLINKPEKAEKEDEQGAGENA